MGNRNKHDVRPHGQRRGRIGMASMAIALPLTSAAIGAPLTLDLLNGTQTDTSSITYDGGTIGAGATYTIDAPNGDTTNTGTLDNNGSIVSHDVLTNDRGVINIGSGAFLNSDGVINNNAGSTINNLANGSILNSYNYFNQGTTNNSGTIDNLSPGGFFNSGQLTNNLSGSITNYSDINNSSSVDNYGTINNHSGFANTGTLRNQLGGTFNNRINGTFTNSSGTLDNDGTFINDGTFNNSRTIDNSGTFTNNAFLGIGGGASLTNTGTFNGNGTLTINGTVSNSGVFSTAGTLNINNGTLNNTNILTVTGTFNNNGVSSQFTNAGQLNIGDGNTGGQLFGDVQNTGEVNFNRSNASTYSGVISGAGGVHKLGANTLTLTGANSYTGGTIIDGGTLALSGASGSIAGSVTLAATGTGFDIAGAVGGRTIDSLSGAAGSTVALGANTLTLGDATSTAFDGVISGTGAVHKQGAGTLTFGGTNTYAGGTVINGGTLALSGAGRLAGSVTLAAAGTGFDIAGAVGGRTIGSLSGVAGSTVALGANALTVGDATDTAFGGVISGTGGLTKQGTDTLTLAGANSYAGATNVDAGTLSVNGSIASLLTTVNAGGTLAGTGTVGDTMVASGGTLSPGNSIGKLTVDGDLTFAAGSRFAVEANPLGADSDLVTVTGIANLDGSVVHVGASGDYDLQSTYRILSAGDLVGSFTGVTSNFAFLTPELLQDDMANTVNLSFSRNTTDFAALAATPNQIATANGIDSIGMAAGSPVYNAIAKLPADANLVQASFDALSGGILASAKTGLISGSHVTVDAIDDRLRSAFNDIGASTSPVLAYGPGGPELAAPSAELLTAWGGAFGSWGHLDSDGNAMAIDSSTGGLLAGADTLVGDWRLGFMAGYGQSSFDSADRTASGSSEDYTLGLYGGTQWGNLAFRSGLAYSWHDMETSRSVALLGETLNGNYGADRLQAFGELGYRFDFGAGGIEPFANLAHVRLNTDGFTETGGAAALTSMGQTTDATFTTLGLRASSKFALGTTLATVHGMVGWRHAFGDTPTTTHAFAGGDMFTIAGAPLTRDAALIEAGFDLGLSATASLGVTYSGQLAADAQDHGISAKLAVKF